tara:strand:+ start:60 stop:329 length:270 start_codon:yes stop_codon:yes gene_type:complete
MECNDNVLTLIDIVVRQTDYDNEKALEQLEKFEYDPIKVIRNYMNPEQKVFYTQSTPKTTNQRVYKEIRTMLDTANAAYRKKKDKEEGN